MTTTTTTTVMVLGIDSVGTVAESDGIRYYLTECCGASAKGCEDGVACRACYHLIDPALGGLPKQPEGSTFDFAGFGGGPLVTVYGDGIDYDMWKAIRGI